MLTPDLLIATYGYPAVAVINLIEGETAMLLGGLAADLGYLEWHWVWAIGFTGAFGLDVLMYTLGRYSGESLLARHPRWRRRAEIGVSRLQAWGSWFVPFIRFAYGMRLAGPFALGLARYPRRKYLLIDAASASIWAALYSGLGYLFGSAAETILGDVRNDTVLAVLLVLLLGVIAAFWKLEKRKHARMKAVSSNESLMNDSRGVPKS